MIILVFGFIVIKFRLEIIILCFFLFVLSLIVFILLRLKFCGFLGGVNKLLSWLCYKLLVFFVLVWCIFKLLEKK